jgi:pimeloyl-ACP methyl ester carboxylesterase
MAKDAIALIDHLKWAQCHVVGVSMGGMISLEFALLAPERILSLTLLATHAGGLAGRAPFVGIRHILRSLVLRDEHLQIENALDMLYGPKTLANPEKRKVRQPELRKEFMHLSFFLILGFP